MGRAAGLPQDGQSLENAVLATECVGLTCLSWPLMIDPQQQAGRWLRGLHQQDGLRLLKHSQAELLAALEGAVRVGAAVLVEGCPETLDAALDPLLWKQTYTAAGGSRTLLRLSEQEINYDSHFKLYLTTAHPNPHFAPETCIKLGVINCTLTAEALEAQLLAAVFLLERPELEAENEARARRPPLSRPPPDPAT